MGPSPKKWMVALLIGLALGVGGRLWSNKWRQSHQTHGAAEAEMSSTSSERGATTALTAGGPGAGDQGTPSAEPETVDGIIASSGFERAERLGRFLISAKPADLERLLLGLRDEGGRRDATLEDAIFLKWMMMDAVGGLAFAEKEGFTSMAWWAWGKTHPEAALAAALARPDALPGTMVVRAIAQSDPKSAQEILERHPQFQEAMAMGGLAAGMMNVDPAAGATLAAAWNPFIDHENLISGWARREPEAALAWAQALPSLTMREEALRVVLDQWAVARPEKIGPFIEALPEGRMKWKLYAEQANRLAAADPEAARAWVEAAPTPLLQREAAVALARGLTASDPSAALEVLRGLDWSDGQLPLSLRRSLRPDGESFFGDHSLASIVMEISAVAPAESLEFVETLSTTPAMQAHLTRGAFQSWVGTDSLGASEWLAGQPAGTTRQSATEQLAIHLSRGASPDFEAAAQWALTLPRENGINGVVGLVFQNWSGRDREAAQAFLDHPDCPLEVRASIALKPQNQ